MITQLRPAELPAWLDSVRDHGTPLVLDVREAAELAASSVPAQGFDLLHIPMGQLPAHLHELDRQRPIACLCHHGGRSMQVASFLLASGFTRVVNIAGGINAWSVELDPAIARY